MTTYFGDDYVTQISDIVLDPSGGQFGPDLPGYDYSQFFGVGGDDLVGDTFRLGGPVIVDIPFEGETEIFRAELFGEIGAQFGLQVDATLDPGSVDAILPYETFVAYPDFDAAALADGDVVDLYFGATFDPTADPDSGFTTEFPSLTFEIGIVTELLVELAAQVGAFGNNTTFQLLDFTVPETYIPIFSLDSDRDITAADVADNPDLNEGDFNPIELFGITTPEIVDNIDGIDTVENESGDVAGIVVELNSFVSSPAGAKADKTDASPTGPETPDDEPSFDLSALDLGTLKIFVPDINTVSKLVDGVFVTDPTKKAEYVYDSNGDRVAINRVDDLDPDGNQLGEGNRDNLAVLTLDLDGLITYATGGTFPPLELGPLDILDGSVGPVSVDASFSYNLLDVELEAALPLEQEFTLTPKLQTQLKFWETDGSGNKVNTEKSVDVQMQQKVLRFDETGLFQDAAVDARLRELAEGNALFAEDIDAFLDLDQGILGGFTGQTGSIGGRMIISRDGGQTWEQLFTNSSDPIAESMPTLGEDQSVELMLDEDTRLGYRLFIGSGSSEVQEDYEIVFDKTQSVYVEEIVEATSSITETPFLDDLNALNVIYDDSETFVEVVSKAVPIVTNRTGLEFDLALLLSGLQASATFEASYDLGPFTIGAGLDFDIGPLFEEKFELLNLDIIDLFNDSFQIEDSETTSFVLGAPAPATDFGTAKVLTSGNDTFTGTADGEEIIALAGEDSIDAAAGNDTIVLGAGRDVIYGGADFDTIDLRDLDGGTFGSDYTFDGIVLASGGAPRGVTLIDAFKFAVPNGFSVVASDLFTISEVERVLFTDLADTAYVSEDADLQVLALGAGNDQISLNFSGATTPVDLTILGEDGDDIVAVDTPQWLGGTVDGGDGFDTVIIGEDFDLEVGTISGGATFANFERVQVSSNSSVEFRGNAANNSLFSEAGNDTLDGREGNDVLIANDGNDTLIGGPGADAMYGGAGVDTADYSDAATSVFIDLDFGGTGRGFRGDAQGDVLDSIENVVGSDFEDILIGDNVANTLTGGLGDDRLQSQQGNDALFGGADNDLLNRGTKATLGGSFANSYHGGDGFDIVAVDVFDRFQQTGKYTADDGGKFTFREGLFTNGVKTAFRDIEIDYRYDRSAHVEFALDETGSGTINYVEDDATARFLATRIDGQAVYGSISFFGDPTWEKRTSNYDINISDQSLGNLRGDTINYPRGDFHDTFGTGTVDSTAGAPNVRGGEFGSETFSDIEGVIGSDGDDALIGNSGNNALFGNGGWDAILGGAGNDRLGFGEAQSLSDTFSFPSGGGGNSSGEIYLTLEQRLALLDPDEAAGTILRGFDRGSSTLRSLVVGDSGVAPAAKINVGDSGSASVFTVGSFLWGGAGIDTLDMRFDRGIGFFPDTSTNYAIVDLNVASAGAPINNFTGEQVQYGSAEWYNSAGSRQSFATTFGVENIIGSRRDDTLTGDRNDNRIEGLDGADVMRGDLGVDTASYVLAEEGVTLNLRVDGTEFALDNARETITGTGDATGDLATEFERYEGSSHDDIVIIEGQSYALPSQFDVTFDYVTTSGAAFITVTETQTINFASFDPANFATGTEVDTGDGNDTVTIAGLGAHDVMLGDGDDAITLRNIGHTIDAGDGNDEITVLDHDLRGLQDLDPALRVTTIDGGVGEDTVSFEGAGYVSLQISDTGVTVTERTSPPFSPDTFSWLDPQFGPRSMSLRNEPEFIAQQNAVNAAVATYELTGVEFVEIGGQRVRIGNPDPIVDADLALNVGEDAIDPYDLGLNITQDDIDAGAQFVIMTLPDTAGLTLEDGSPVTLGQFLTAAEIAALKVAPGQNFDPARDAFSYIRVGDPMSDVRTTSLPDTIRGTALNITAHLTEVEIDTTPAPTPEASIDLVRLNPSPIVGATPAAIDLEYATTAAFADMPSGSTTVEFLFRSAGALDPDGPDQVFLSYSAGGNNNELLFYGDLDTDRGMELSFNGVRVETGYRVEQLFDREVHRFSAVFDTTANTMELFIDGASVFSDTVGALGTLANGGSLFFGQEQDAPGGGFDPNQTIKGDIGDIRIWNSARTEAEINATAFTEIADPGAETDLAAYWQADATNAGVLVNAVGDDHLNLVNNPEIVTVEAPSAPSVTVIPTVRVNANKREIEYIQSNPTPMPTGDVTIEFVMQGLELPEDFSERQHFASYAVPGSNNEFLMWLDGTNGDGEIGFAVGGNAGIDTNVPSSVILDGQPHRISMTLNTATDIATLYVDGEVIYEGTAAGPVNLISGGSFNFGQEQDTVGGTFDTNQEVRADFGDIRLWDTVRTQEEILDTAFIQIADPASEAGLVANWQVDPSTPVSVPDLLGGPNMFSFGGPALGSVTFPVPETVTPPADVTPTFVTQVVDQQGDPVTITVDEVPTNGTVFFMAPDPGLLAVGITFPVETPVMVGDTLTPAQLEALYFRGSENFSGDAGAFTYTVRDDVSFRQLPSTLGADANTATDADLNEGAASQTITFDVTPVNDAPTIKNVLFPISPGGELESTIRVADPESADVTVALVGEGQYGFVRVNPDGSFSYKQNKPIDFQGAEFIEDTFTVTATEVSATPPLSGAGLLPGGAPQSSELAPSTESTQTVRIINPAFQSEIVFDPDNPDFFDDDGNPINLGGLGTDDVIRGHDGPDGLFGFGGNDTLSGGSGNDTLSGGSDADVFVFAFGDGLDEVTDFEVGTDLIDLRGLSIEFEDLVITDDGGDARVAYGPPGQDEILLSGVAPGEVTEELFLFDRLFAETGFLTLTNTPQVITLERTYENPVAVAFVATENGADPVDVRVSAVTGDKVTLRLQEPNYLDGNHGGERVNYMVVEAGTWILPDGTLLEAGTVDTPLLTSQGFQGVSFAGAFDQTPVILSQVQTLKGQDFVSTRQRQADRDGFEVAMQEDEATNGGNHTSERLGWVAIEAGSGTAGEVTWAAGNTGGVSDAGRTVDIGQTFAGDVNAIANLASFIGADPAWARGSARSPTSFDVSAEEDQSRDTETAHANEAVDWFAFEQAGVLQAAPVQEVFETGFLTLTNTPQVITLERTYENPVAVAFVATENGADPVDVRVSAVTGDKVTLRLQEPNYLDGNHGGERVNYMVVEAGTWILPDGTLLEAGTVDTPLLTSQGFQGVSFAGAFDQTPVILSQVQTLKGQDFVSTRQRQADRDGFEVAMQEDEATNGGNHTSERLGWVAIEAGSGTAGEVTWAAGNTGGVSDAGRTVDIGQTFAGDVNAIANLASFIGADPAWARGSARSPTSFDVSAEEDQSRDTETAHANEAVDWFAFEQAGLGLAYDADLLI